MDFGYTTDTDTKWSKKKIFKRNSYDQRIYQGYMSWLDNDHSELQVSEDLLTFDFNNKCGYCLRAFDSRNKLFNHLGFCNVNINNSVELVPSVCYLSENDLPKNIKRIRNKKRIQFLKWGRKEKKSQKNIVDYFVPTQKQEKIKDDCDELTNSFTKIRINNSIQRNKNARNDLISSLRNMSFTPSEI